MKKIFVLDTNVLLHDPTALTQFEDNDVVIPVRVIEEIDNFKRDVSERGRNARQVSRSLDEFRKRGKLSVGVPLDSGGSLRVTLTPQAGRAGDRLSVDDQIIATARDIQQAQPQTPCIVVSKDINLRIKADAMGLEAQDYETDRVDISELYPGYSDLTVSTEELDTFRRDGRHAIQTNRLSPNEYVLLRDGTSEAGHSFLSRYDHEAGALVPLMPTPEAMRVVQPRNKEQHYAVDALLNDAVKVVTIIGKAGTGKTLLAVAAALHQTMETRHYRRMLICRPTIPMGKDIGFLPGTMEEKLNPWMQPIFDALDFLSNGKRAGWKRGEHGIDDERIGIEPLSYIRGRSIPNQYIVVDEAQNLTPLEAKTVLTRVGPGTKIVLTGDIYQIDNPYVDSMSNGLTYIVERFRTQPIAAHILLSKGVRSEVAELAANLL